MKIKSLFLGLLLTSAAVVNAQTLNLGKFENYSDQDGNYYAVYNFNVWEQAPISFAYEHSGSQIIYEKEGLKPMAGKNITKITFAATSQSMYQKESRKVKIYIAETNGNTFHKQDTKKYYYDAQMSPLVCETEKTYDYSYTDNGTFFMDFKLDKPFYYSGENNLILTFIAEGKEVNPGIDGINYHIDHQRKANALNFSSQSKGKGFEYTLNSTLDDKTSEGTTITYAPAIQFEYTDGKPNEKFYIGHSTKVPENFKVNKLKAYIAYLDGDIIRYQEVESAQANTAVILETEVNPAFEYSTDAKSYTNNELKASDGTVVSDGNVWIFKTGDKGTGFYKQDNGTKIENGVIYIKGKLNGDFIAFSLKETPSGIHCIKNVEAETNNTPIYNLSGQRVNNNYKGIVIKNGKKYLNK